jgi:thiamine-phosphate pyrophosphorylase
MAIAHPRRLKLLIAGDALLAGRIGAHGLHLAEAHAHEAFDWKARRPRWLVTAAAHSARALSLAGLWGADAALLAPAFPTLSHRGRAAIPLTRFLLIAARSRIPVYALGGVNAATVKRLAGASLAGIAAIEGLRSESRSDQSE